MKLLALKLFNSCKSIQILLKELKPSAYYIHFGKLSLLNSPHRGSIFRINEIVARSVEVGGCDINLKDIMDDTPLAWAAGNGHEAVVKLLRPGRH